VEKATRIKILGREHEARGQVFVQDLEPLGIALGTTAGTLAKPNEDCAGVCVLGSERILAIADGHWGRDASELGVSKAMELLRENGRPSKESETRARLFALFDQVNTELYELATSAPGAPTPETTLIVCHVKQETVGKYLYWASFGDSYLFLMRNNELKQINSLNPFWLGYLSRLSENSETKSILMRFLSDEARYVGVASGLETGIESIGPGDIILLCTDGLIGSDVLPEPAILEAICRILTSGLRPVEKVKQTIASALARGEEDNMSCLIAKI
jgi:protein phosphatase